MKNNLAAAALVGLPMVVLYLFFKSLILASTPAKTAASQDAAVARALATARPSVAGIIASNFSAASTSAAFHKVPDQSVAAPAGQAGAVEFTNLAPATVLENVRTVIRNYGARFGGNPVGNNAEISHALGGGNPGQVNYLSPEAGLRVNSAGELVDVWGTPLFFHQLSGREMEIHSAGPDGKLWTADDLVTE